MASDFLKVWPPWAAQLADGKLPHNTDLSDSILYYLPSRQYAAAAVSEGRLPLWNPYIFSGTPFLANGESGVFSPLNVFFYLCRTPAAFGYTAALQLFLAGLFMYLLLRRLEIRPPGALFGALVFMLNGFFIVWLEMLNLVGVALWIPVGILAADRWIRTRSAGAMACLAGLIALQFLVGFLQVSLYLLVAVFGYAVLRVWREPARSTRSVVAALAGVSAATVGGVTLAAVSLVPHLELILRSHREATPAPWQVLDPEHLRHLVTLVLPDYFGTPVGNGYHGPANYTELCGYVGVAPLLIALHAVRRWKNRSTLYFVVVAVGALLVYLETPLNLVLWYVVPGYRLGIGSTRIICLFTFAMAGLAGIGFDSLLEGAGARRLWRPLLAGVLFLLSLADLLRFGSRHLTMAEAGSVFPPVRAVDFLRHVPGKWRMMSTPGVFPPNSAMAYGVETVEGYESLFPRRYKEYMATIDSVGRDPDFHGIVLSRYDSPLLDLLDVRFVVSDEQLSGNGMRLVYDDGARIYERSDALPRAFVVWRFRTLPSRAAALAALRGRDFRPGEEAILEKDPGMPSSQGAGQAEVEWDAYEPQRVALHARLSAPGLLILADSFYPGWEVRVDGERREVLVADYILRAVALDGGDHRVEFQFRPASFRLGAIISVASLLAIVAGLVSWRLRLASPGHVVTGV